MLLIKHIACTLLKHEGSRQKLGTILENKVLQKIGAIKSLSSKSCFLTNVSNWFGNALQWVQREHEPSDIWDNTFSTRRF